MLKIFFILTYDIWNNFDEEEMFVCFSVDVIKGLMFQCLLKK